MRNRKTVGHINLEGYFTCIQVADALQKLGYVPNDVFLTLNHLVKTELIITDRMNSSEVEWEDSVKILAAGWVHIRLLSERFEYLYGVIPTTPIRDQNVAEQLAELVKIEAARGELDYHQQIRAVDIFYRYLWSERTTSTTPFNEGPESGADYVLPHIRSAIELRRNPSKVRRTVDADVLDF